MLLRRYKTQAEKQTEAKVKETPKKESATPTKKSVKK